MTGGYRRAVSSSVSPLLVRHDGGLLVQGKGDMLPQSGARPLPPMPPPSSSSLLSCNSHKNEHHSPRLGSLARRRSPPSENASRTRRLAAGQSRHSRTSRCTGEFHHWELQNQIPRIPGPIPSSSLQENTFAIIGSARRERWAWNSFATRGCPSKHKKPIAPYTRHVHLTHKR